MKMSLVLILCLSTFREGLTLTWFLVSLHSRGCPSPTTGAGQSIAIGNVDPQQLLHGLPDTADTSTAFIRVTSGDRTKNTGIDLGSDAGDGNLNVVSNGNLKLSTNNDERLV